MNYVVSALPVSNLQVVSYYLKAISLIHHGTTLNLFTIIGLSADGDVDTFNRRRAVEIKHGRVAMLAVTGYIIQNVSRFPGAIDLDGRRTKRICI